MKAIVQDRYGSPEEVLHVEEIDIPEIGANQVLVRVQASAVAGDDWHLMRGLPYIARTKTGLRRPKHRVPGREVAGRVEAVGTSVRSFAPGDDVFGWCDGAFAQYAAVEADSLALKPTGLTPEQAAVVPISAFTALQALRDAGKVQAGHRVLILGASGGVGTFAVQLAKTLGAEVTGVCSTPNVDLVKSVGADHVIDYTQEDFAGAGPRFDVIIDLVGNRSLREARRALRPRGTLVLVGGSGRGGRWFKGTHRFLGALLLSPFVAHQIRPLIHRDDRDDLATIAELITSGQVQPVVTTHYRLDEVGKAIGHFAAGHARGKVAVVV